MKYPAVYTIKDFEMFPIVNFIFCFSDLYALSLDIFQLFSENVCAASIVRPRFVIIATQLRVFVRRSVTTLR